MHESRLVTIILEKLSIRGFRRSQALFVCQGGELKFSGVNCLGLTFKFPEKYIREKCLSILIPGKAVSSPAKVRSRWNSQRIDMKPRASKLPPQMPIPSPAEQWQCAHLKSFWLLSHLISLILGLRKHVKKGCSTLELSQAFSEHLYAWPGCCFSAAFHEERGVNHAGIASLALIPALTLLSCPGILCVT